MNLKSKFCYETTSIMKKKREKFDYNRDTKKYGNNFAGVLIRTTGRKIVDWRRNLN